MKQLRVAVAALVLGAVALTSLAAADNITGLWKQLNEKTGKAQSLVYIYSYQGKLYGRMLAIYKDDGATFDETIVSPKTRSVGIVGTPYDCGMDFVYQLVDNGKEWGGGIIDPGEGKDYNCRAWKDGVKLILRGQLKGIGGFLGRNQTWMPASTADLPPGYTLPATIVPVVPQKG